MSKKIISKLAKNDISSILKTYGKRLIGIGILIGFLLFLLNVFVGLSAYSSSFGDTLKDRLGIYFYIRDIPGQEAATYKKIITLKEDLESHGLKVLFSSKEDAFKFLEKRVPELISNLEKFNISNPLPATLYVMFKNDTQYKILKEAVLKHKDIILNINDISQGDSIKQQENRILNIINITNFVKFFLYILIIVISLIILSFLLFLVNNIFNKFYIDLSIKKLLGATQRQINESFLRILLQVISMAFVLNIILLSISIYATSFFLNKVFDINLRDYLINNIFSIVVFLILEFAVVVGLSLYSSSILIKKLTKKVH